MRRGYSLKATPQQETAKENAKRLERALRGLEALYGATLDFDSTTSYANVEIVDYTDNLPS